MRALARDEPQRPEGGREGGRAEGKERVEEGKSLRDPEAVQVNGQTGGIRKEAGGRGGEEAREGGVEEGG